MPTDRWSRIEQLFLEAAELPASQRADLLARGCGEDTGLREEVGSLLTAAERSADFLSTPALDAFARQVSREGWSLQPGDRVASYTVQRRLGAGGMGEVWRARDERLGRDVAIKLLLPHPSNAEVRLRAFQNEARAAGSLNHNNVLTVYDVGDHGGAPYIVMECLEGEPLRARLVAGALSVDAALDVARQVAQGLGAAHARGIVHRDLKPENIFLALDGRVKILDFGLATLHDLAASPATSLGPPAGTTAPLGAGTAGYTAPEQVRGEVADQRADIFALGAVLYEMLAGRRPFQADSTFGTLHAVLTLQPPDLSDTNPAIPIELSRIVRRCLARAPENRFATVTEFLSGLESVIRARSPARPSSLLALVRQRAVIVPAIVAVLALAAGGWRWYAITSRGHWARTAAAPEIQRLAIRGDYTEAFLLARQALAAAPDDPQLRQLWLDVSFPTVVTTEPAGADVAIAPYRESKTIWSPLGRTPLRGIRIPRTIFRVRMTKAGFQPIEGSGGPGGMQRYRLDPVDAVPPGMVRVVAGRDPVRFGEVGELDDFWIDRFEVTNRQFKEFVDHAGYTRRDYWREPFLEDGRSVPWAAGIERFHDATGWPGPATWTSGTYPAGQDDFPVGGVSWYEATAYSAFVGKALPTMYHWYRAAALGRFADILTVSNFGGRGPAPVGSYHGVGPFGTYDMAGNVKEWCSNETDHRRRFLLGGAWNEARYMFADFDARSPFERAPSYGFRLVKYTQPLPPAVTAAVGVETLSGDTRKQSPVDESTFAVYRRQYGYDRTPINAAVEATEGTEAWVKQTVSFDAAYDHERLRAFLFLPRSGSPPYQTVIFFPAADAFLLGSSRDMSLASVGFVIRSGRALLYPVFKGTYERRIPDQMGQFAERELRIAWSRDLGRAIDYLETRPDVDRTRLAFYGVSAGADAGVILTALEPRLKASVLQGTGIGSDSVPEIDLRNYAPRVHVPTLLLNGRYDFETRFETDQRPLFALLGPPATDKRHAVFETGHALPIEEVASEILSWLDRYLGVVVH
jgi:eukaryotic-like serine/threonine-protein kinase